MHQQVSKARRGAPSRHRWAPKRGTGALGTTRPPTPRQRTKHEDGGVQDHALALKHELLGNLVGRVVLVLLLQQSRSAQQAGGHHAGHFSRAGEQSRLQLAHPASGYGQQRTTQTAGMPLAPAGGARALPCPAPRPRSPPAPAHPRPAPAAGPAAAAGAAAAGAAPAPGAGEGGGPG